MKSSSGNEIQKSFFAGVSMSIGIAVGIMVAILGVCCFCCIASFTVFSTAGSDPVIITPDISKPRLELRGEPI